MHIRRHFGSREGSETVSNFGEVEVQAEQGRREGPSGCESQIGVKGEKGGPGEPEGHRG